MKKSNKEARLREHLAYVALLVLRKNDSQMSLHDMLDEVEKQEVNNIPAELKILDEKGVAKWRNRLQLASIIFEKSGYLKKGGGVWSLTGLGEKALGEHSEAALIKEALAEYSKQQKQKRLAQKKLSMDSSNIDVRGDVSLEGEGDSNLENYQASALREIEKHIRSLNPYEFQNLCESLLRGMGYYIRSEASVGPDGGIDILAYTDSLGSRSPRLKVQVKHQEGKVGRPVLDQLMGLLTEGDIGILISSSGFARGCHNSAQDRGKHIDLINMKRFVKLWKEHYGNISEQDKSLLPLEPVYFLDTRRLKRD